MNLEGKVALVTGAARGIGRAHALHLANLGCDIVVSDVNFEAWKEFGGEELSAPTVMDEVRKLGRRSLGVACDVTKSSEVKSLIEAGIREFGKIDFLINNAGGLAGKVEDSFATKIPERDLYATFERNLFGTIYCCQTVAPYMQERRYGKILTTSSQAGMRSQSGGVYASYGAAKAGVLMYTKYLAAELGPFNINVNCIAPAFVATKRLNTIFFGVGDNLEKSVKQVPLGRMAEPEDIVKAAAYLLDDDASYITGQCISICGGVINF